MFQENSIREKISKHYDSIASKRDIWFKRNKYYHLLLFSKYKFYVEPNKSILEIGCGTGELLACLKPSFGVGIDISSSMVSISKKKFSTLDFYNCNVENLKIDATFDYIIISNTLNEISDITAFFSSIKRFCNNDTRILFDTYNHLWSPVLRLAEKLGLKIPEKKQNWLHIPQIASLLNMTDFEMVTGYPTILCPLYMPVLSWVLNKIVSRLPIFRHLCLNFFFIARLNGQHAGEPSVTVCITVRDEKESIEPLIKNIPTLGRFCEIIFVEGHSTDGTPQEIRHCMEKYPEKDIRLITQDGIGQQDAIHKGFFEAKGDVIFLLEGDLTTPPQDLKYMWDAYRSNKAEFISGNRLTYMPVSNKSMRFWNFVGNKMFGFLIRFLVVQRLDDTLSGLKGISKKNYLRLRKFEGLWGKDPFGDYELIFGAAKLGLKIGEVPISYEERAYGLSKTRVTKHGVMLLKMCIKQFRLL